MLNDWVPRSHATHLNGSQELVSDRRRHLPDLRLLFCEVTGEGVQTGQSAHGWGEIGFHSLFFIYNTERIMSRSPSTSLHASAIPREKTTEL